MANKRIMKQIKEEAGSKSKTSLDTLKPLILKGEENGNARCSAKSV